LDRVVTLNIDGQSLGAAIAQLRDKTKLNIVLGTPAITGQLGSPPDGTPVAAQAELKDVEARAALRALLDPYDLTFVVLGDSILITTEEAATARQMRQRVSVHLDKVELVAALKQLARDTGVNLPLDPRAGKQASAKVSLDVEDVPLETGVRLLAEMAGLKPVRLGNTLFVTKKEVATAMRADPDLNPPRQAAVDYKDREVAVNARIWLAQGRLVFVAPGAFAPPAPIGVGAPLRVQSTEEAVPANSDAPPPPEKKDGDK